MSVKPMSALLLAALLCSAAAVNAQGQPPLAPDSQQFAVAKQNLLSRLSKVTSCVNAAKTYAEMEVCRQVPPHGGEGTQHLGEEGEHPPLAKKP